MSTVPTEAYLKGAKASALSNIRSAELFYAPFLEPVAAMRRQGLSLRAIAAELTRQKIQLRQGWERWNPVQISRILVRAKKAGLCIDSDRSPIVAQNPSSDVNRYEQAQVLPDDSSSQQDVSKPCQCVEQTACISADSAL